MYRALSKWNRASFGLVACSLVIQTGCISSAEPSLDATVAPFLCSPCGGVAVAVVRDGRVILKKGYGPSDIERHTSIEPDTVFDLASVAKQFTGVALLVLAQRGRLSMHDDYAFNCQSPGIRSAHANQNQPSLSTHVWAPRIPSRRLRGDGCGSTGMAVIVEDTGLFDRVQMGIPVMPTTTCSLGLSNVCRGRPSGRFSKTRSLRRPG